MFRSFLFLLALPLAFLVQAEEPREFSYRLTMKGTGKFAPDAPFEIHIGSTYTRFVYKDRVEFRSDSLSHKNVLMKKVMHEDYFDAKGGWIINEKGEKQIHSLADEEAKTRAEVWFIKPILTAELDENGGEKSRKYSTHPAADYFIKNGSLENYTMFHGRYPDPSGKWSRKVEQPNVMAGKIAGEFHYEKAQAPSEGKLQAFTVKGTLKDATETVSEEGQRTRNYEAVFTGTCHYDPDSKEWVSGELKNTQSMELFNGKEWEKGVSNWVITLEALPKK